MPDPLVPRGFPEAEATGPYPGQVRTTPVVRTGGTEQATREWGPFVQASSAARVAELEMRLRRIAAEIRAAGLLDEGARLPAHTSIPAAEKLTARQAEVLARFLQGHRASTIARELYVSPSTVRNHLAAIFRRLEVHSQSELLELLQRRSEAAQPPEGGRPRAT